MEEGMRKQEGAGVGASYEARVHVQANSGIFFLDVLLAAIANGAMGRLPVRGGVVFTVHKLVERSYQEAGGFRAYRIREENSQGRSLDVVHSCEAQPIANPCLPCW